ncbi:MAG: aspartate/glutamate racemase family protein [Pseudohongiellaceae bacterium]
MKTIGMLGGMSWESTSTYYRLLNEGVKSRLGSLHSAQLCLYSVDFAEIERLQRTGDWQATADILGRAARQVEAGGADFLLICTNTMHKVAPEIAASINIPLIHITDATADALRAANHSRVGLLGTRFTMEQDFCKRRLTDQFGIEVLVPEDEERDNVHQIIYNELCQGLIKESSRKYFLTLIDKLAAAGAEAVILGCTEIAMLVEQPDTPVPLFDTTAIHCRAAVNYALED